MYTPNIIPTRPTDVLRTLPYADMNSAELDKLRQEDPAAYQVAEDTLNGVQPAAAAEAPLPVEPRKNVIWRNGVQVEVPSAVRFVNGIPVE